MTASRNTPTNCCRLELLLSSRMAVESHTTCMLLLLPVVAEEAAAYRRSTCICYAKFRMGSVTYISKTIPVALPEQQRRCVVMVGYTDR